MRKATKVTISLPTDILQKVERERSLKDESRSEFILHAVQQLLRQEEEREAVEQYIRSYEECPETDEEVAEAEALAVAALSHVPWDPDE